MRCGLAAVLAAGVSLLPLAAWADGAVGSSNVAPIEPTAVPVPDSTPCVVSLFGTTTFGGDSVPFSFKPPAACPGPWAKVVLQADLSVTAGRQFDRTGSIMLGGVPLFFGTTAEPRAALSPSWHVERDVTEDTALFESPQTGSALIQNYVTSVYTGVLSASAKLLFYPATARFPAPATPDLVVPLNPDVTAGPTMLNTGTATLSRTGSLPRNVEKGRLDVYLQSQSNDEFWYTCVPDALADTLETCGGGAFREGMVTVDGIRAGVAPVYPWIYTGGIDPYLWEPIPGVQTIKFEPTHVELTPFAGMIDDGKPHTIAVAVRGANSGFSVTGALYLWLDHGAKTLEGSLLRDTLGEATPSVTNTITSSNGTASGDVDTGVTHDYLISGILRTSHGPVVTTVAQHGTFSNKQSFTVSDTVDNQAIVQNTDTLTSVTTSSAAGVRTVATARSYPLNVHFDYIVAADGSATQATQVVQTLKSGTLRLSNGLPTRGTATVETVSPNDTLAFNANGAVTGHTGSGTASYLFGDTKDGCVARYETSSNSVLASQNFNSACDILGALGGFAGYSKLPAFAK
ncbi:hypothetical protein NFI95_02255 [Acetobacteraceae bacterium KSS8]|uniref:Peptide N-acetyl-beta-D-glucosaminyl asparaginase amidase A N-terminal domain-containing protein n=1 Tax=Endosaccharibacter trunci TaxID=2812733 RepID=A0ABT1W323_9PROT|nr:hypothetical protein [Acetobacteraceae bacterium KSS8]